MVQLLEDCLRDIVPGFVVVPEALDLAIAAKLDAEIAKWPDAAKERDLFRSQLISFFSAYGYLPEFSLEPRAAAKIEGPYPGCHHPEQCNATGRCPRDPVCFN